MELFSIKGRRLALVLILAVVGVTFVRNHIGTYAVVDGVSMIPTFRPLDIVCARTAHAQTERGDVVIITDDRGDRVMKRIIGLPGETVTLYGGCVYINNQRLSEPYLARHTYTFKSDIHNERPMEWRLAENEYFVMGDNRLYSHDSRNFGPVARPAIHQLVSLPHNSPRPEFCGIFFIKTDKGASARYRPVQNQSRTPPPTADSKT